jgi:tripartite-type tricarboxylate transporter receptor subunit TctC
MALAALSIFLVGSTVSAADFPSQPIRLVVPYPAGGSTDISARLIAEKLSEVMKNPVVIENKPGGATTIGTVSVTTARPDGHTLLYAGPATILTPLIQTPQFDIKKDLKPVSLTAKSSLVVVVKDDYKARTLAELVEEAKANPGKMDIGIPGLGSGNHMALEMFKRTADIDVKTIPFQGNAPQLTALVGGVISVAFDSLLTSAPFIKSGQLRPLAVTGTERSKFFPDVPTVAEQGYPDYQSTYWNGIYAPAGTPDDVIATLNKAFDQAVNDPDTKAKLLEMSFESVGGEPKVMDDFATAENELWSKFVKENDIKMQ